MGCGASKVAAAVDEKSITIKTSPYKEHPHQIAPTEQHHTAHHQVIKGPSQQTVRTPNYIEISTTTSAVDTTDTTVLQVNEDTTVARYPPPVAFDVPLNEDGTPMERKSFPKKLERVSLPALTKEQLDDKQKAVLERKEKELQKRKESRGRRASQLRREIMVARETEVDLHASSTNGGLNALQEDTESLTGNLETDITYNATSSQEDIWTES